MATLTPVAPAFTGTVFAPAAASAGGDAFANPRGNAFFYVKNGSGGSLTVTFGAVAGARPADGPYPAMTLSNNAVAVAAGVEKIIGPIPSGFNDGSGNVQVTYSGVTTLTVGVIQPN